jgi:hypothetical protein
MTNHPRSPKFRIGQVVAVRSPQVHGVGPKYFAITLREKSMGLTFYGDGKNPQYHEGLLRPLTKKEAGR